MRLFSDLRLHDRNDWVLVLIFAPEIMRLAVETDWNPALKHRLHFWEEEWVESVLIKPEKKKIPKLHWHFWLWITNRPNLPLVFSTPGLCTEPSSETSPGLHAQTQAAGMAFVCMSVHESMTMHMLLSYNQHYTRACFVLHVPSSVTLEVWYSTPPSSADVSPCGHIERATHNPSLRWSLWFWWRAMAGIQTSALRSLCQHCWWNMDTADTANDRKGRVGQWVGVGWRLQRDEDIPVMFWRFYVIFFF